MSNTSSLAHGNQLQLDIFTPGDNPIFHVTSTLIQGPTEVVLVDAQFEKRHALQLVDAIKNTHKKLTYIYISHNDPDYYFGASEIAKSFPEAKIISTPQTAYLIDTTKENKLQVWKDKMGKEAPTTLITPTPYTAPIIHIDDQSIEIIKDYKHLGHSYLWIPTGKTIVGGASVSIGSHLWLADSVNLAGVDDWIDRINEMKERLPTKVIPSHMKEIKTGKDNLDFVKAYLEHYKHAFAVAPNSESIVEYMSKQYSDLPDTDTLKFSTDVLLGKAQWAVASPYPPIEREMSFKIDDERFNLYFIDNKILHFTNLEAIEKAEYDTAYETKEIAPSIFMLTWHDPTSQSHRLQIQNFSKNTVIANTYEGNGSQLRANGVFSIKSR